MYQKFGKIKDMKILGIETAVDETAAAVVEDGYKILSDVISSQTNLHAKYGGVVPEVAARNHIARIIPIIRVVLKECGLDVSSIDAIAVATTPGLLIALLAGIETAKTLAFVFNKPLMAINDLESHAYANWLEKKDLLARLQDKSQWPLIYLIVSGGTTALFLAHYFGDYKLIGQTRDDACGEAFDKIAKLLGLPYPGGPAIQKSAEEGDASAFDLPRPMLNTPNFDFSFSGLKTAAFREVKSCQKKTQQKNLSPSRINDFAASVQEAIADVLVTKTLRAAKKYQAKAIAVGGGVAANTRLRELLLGRSNVPVFFPPVKFCTDNAAMLAGCAHYYAKKGIFTPWQKTKPFFYTNIKGKTCEF